jgi:hypothetical protein
VLLDFLSSFLGAGLAAALLGFLGKEWLAVRIKDAIEREAALRRSIFEIKRDACLEALSIVDASFSHRKWEQDGTALPVQQQPVDIAKARSCYSKLALTCDDPEVLVAYCRALDLRGPADPPNRGRAQAIVELRNVMRRELGFGKPLPPMERLAVWIAHLEGAGPAGSAQGRPAV